MTANVLTVEHLTKQFPGAVDDAGEPLLAVNDVSFTVPAGGSLAVVGESGSGKTTVARIVAGLEDASSGRVVLPDADGAPARARLARARAVQMVFQDPYSSLDPRQSIGAAIDEVLALHTRDDRKQRRARVADLLDQVGLDARHAEARPRTLSGGQRQRAAIARALAANPRLLILDEAVAALDVSVQAQVLSLLAQLRRELGIAYLFISHDLAVVRQISDQCVVMHHGRIVERGETAALLSAPKHPYTIRLIAAIPREGWVPRRALTGGSQ